MRVAIIDDEKEAREKLAGFISRYGAETGTALTVTAYESGDALLAGYSPVYGIIIFDIDMPGTSGMDTARQVRAMDGNVVILFVTNMAQYAINGYEVEAIDYMIKPVAYYDFSLKFARAVRRAEASGEKKLVLATGEGITVVSVSDILYVEVLGHYLSYHLRDRLLTVRGTMAEQEALLVEYHFVRVHKSYMVNMRHIGNFSAADVTVAGEKVPLGRAYKQGLMTAYMAYLRG